MPATLAECLVLGGSVCRSCVTVTARPASGDLRPPIIPRWCPSRWSDCDLCFAFPSIHLAGLSARPDRVELIGAGSLGYGVRDRPQLRLRANKLPSPNHCVSRDFLLVFKNLSLNPERHGCQSGVFRPSLSQTWPPHVSCYTPRPLGRRGAPRRHRAPRRSAETGLRRSESLRAPTSRMVTVG